MVLASNDVPSGFQLAKEGYFGHLQTHFTAEYAQGMSAIASSAGVESDVSKAQTILDRTAQAARAHRAKQSVRVARVVGPVESGLCDL